MPLADFFVEKGYQVNGSVKSENRMLELSSKSIIPFLIDLENLSSNIKDFLKSKVLIISVPNKNVNSFRELINEIIKSEIDKLLFISSTSVYENKNKIIYESDHEESLTAPLSIIENMFKNTKSFQTTIVRFGGLIGYDRNPAYFYKNSQIVKNPEGKVNMIHRDDCIYIIGEIIEKSVWGEALNCCADSHPTKIEYYTFLADKYGLASPKFEKSQGKHYKIISNDKLKQLLNYKFIYPDIMKVNFEKST